MMKKILFQFDCAAFNIIRSRPLPAPTSSLATRQYSQATPSYRSSLGLCRATQTPSPGRLVRNHFRGIHSPSQHSTNFQQIVTPIVHEVFETRTGSWQYVVADSEAKAAVIIDPVLDYDPVTQSVGTESADTLLALVKDRGYKVDRILETHAHADHITAASYLQKRLAESQAIRPQICIGSRIGQVQQRFSPRYNIPLGYCTDVFDQLLQDDEEFTIGNIVAKAVHIPGHTPDHMGYKIGDNIFSGDLIFHKDLGTARADFPGGSASEIYRSARKVLSLPDHTRIWAGHDYPPDGREPVSSMTVKEHREQNKHVMDSMAEGEFIKMREARDAILAAPRLLHQSLQMNIRAGRLPIANESGLRLLRLPLKLGKLSW